MTGFWSLAALTALTAALCAGAPGDYVGAGKCGACHAEQFRTQSAGGHAHSLRPAAEHPLTGSFTPEQPLRRGSAYTFEITRDAPGLKIRVSGDGKKLELPLEWAFGAGGQAVTFVSRMDEDSYIEHHFSYYTALGRFDATPGHAGRDPKSLVEAAGVYYKTFDPRPKIMRCFACHSTGGLDLGSNMDLRPAELGVRCEACHGPGRPHVEAVAKNDIAEARRLIRNPKRLPASEVNQLCGGCHREPLPAGAATDWNDPWNVRHQPLYLNESACFRESLGKLSCFTCHEPHQALRRNDPAYYDARCASCHGVVKAHGRRENCAGCHMPPVEPRQGLRFANHWIGNYAEGAPLRPMGR